jgi:hypothetical protein
MMACRYLAPLLVVCSGVLVLGCDRTASPGASGRVPSAPSAEKESTVSGGVEVGQRQRVPSAPSAAEKEWKLLQGEWGIAGI